MEKIYFKLMYIYIYIYIYTYIVPSYTNRNLNIEIKNIYLKNTFGKDLESIGKKNRW